MDFSISKMIIKLDIMADQARKHMIKVNYLVQEVARASRRGDHIFVIPRPFAIWISENLNLRDDEREHIVKLGNSFAELESRFMDARWKILVDVNFQEPKMVRDGVWKVGVDYILNYEEMFLQPIQLLVENGTHDGAFYMKMICAEAKRRQFGKIKIKISHGGGGDIGAELIRVSGDGHAVICICDSDKFTPYQPSENHASIIKKFNKCKSVGIVLRTPGKSAENFLPLSICRQISNKSNGAEILERKLNDQDNNVSSGDCLWLYFDVKQGMNQRKCRKYCNETNSNNWILSKYKLNDKNFHDFPNIKGFGDDILEKFIRDEDIQSEFIRFMDSDYWELHFENWLEDILWLSCARKRERAS